MKKTEKAGKPRKIRARWRAAAALLLSVVLVITDLPPALLDGGFGIFG
ncbi:MAG: hypothetical protein K5686_06595 [Lachnospiraceae bacterium]|nr:hypothetical protein [Lachnospiraceae bacterium]